MLSLALIFVGCEKTSDNIYFSEKSGNKIEFPSKLLDYTTVPISDIDKYKSPYGKYSSNYFKDLLTEQEKELYDTIVYAFDNGWNYIMFPNQKYTYKQMEKVLRFASCDNPMIETNIRYAAAASTISGIGSKSGITLYINAATKEKQKKRIEALDKAKEIIKSMPASASEMDRAWYLYNVIVSNVQYSEDYSNEDANYLYDALVNKKTNCDGFSQAVSLLFNMAHIDTFSVYYFADDEVINFLQKNNLPVSLMFNGTDKDSMNIKPEFDYKSSDSEKQQNVENLFQKYGVLDKAKAYFDVKTETDSLKWNLIGHAWNIAKIDGKYYKFDASSESVLKNDIDTPKVNTSGMPIQLGAYFAMADSTMIDKFNVYSSFINEYVPPCTDLQYENKGTDLVSGSCNEVEAVHAAVQKLMENSKNKKSWISVRFRQTFTQKEIDKYAEKVCQKAEVNLNEITVNNQYCVLSVSP